MRGSSGGAQDAAVSVLGVGWDDRQNAIGAEVESTPSGQGIAQHTRGVEVRSHLGDDRFERAGRLVARAVGHPGGLTRAGKGQAPFDNFGSRVALGDAHVPQIARRGGGKIPHEHGRRGRTRPARPPLRDGPLPRGMPSFLASALECVALGADSPPRRAQGVEVEQETDGATRDERTRLSRKATSHQAAWATMTAPSHNARTRGRCLRSAGASSTDWAVRP